MTVEMKNDRRDIELGRRVRAMAVLLREISGIAPDVQVEDAAECAAIMARGRIEQDEK